MALDPAVARVAGEPMLPRAFAVRSNRRETPDTVTLTLELLAGEPLAFTPGQFTMLGRPGHGEVPISISGDPRRPARLVHTVRAVGDATRAVARARRGDVLLARGPYGQGWHVGDGAGGDVVIVAGGIGLAPLRPALLEALAGRDRYRRVVLVYGSRTPEQLLYRRELARWEARPDLDVAVTVDAAGADWCGRVGVVTTLLPEGMDPDRTLALVCGPEVMMRLTAEELLRRGVPAERIRLSLERSMACGVGLCGHCQLRELFVCLDGPVFDYGRVRTLMTAREL